MTEPYSHIKSELYWLADLDHGVERSDRRQLKFVSVHAYESVR